MKKIFRLFLFMIFLSGIRNLNAQLNPNGILFDGFDDIVTVPYPFSMGNSNFTIEMYFKTQSSGYLCSIYPTNGNGNGLGIYLDQQGHPNWSINGFGAGINSLNLSDNQCHHLAFIKQGTLTYMYIDTVKYNFNIGVPDTLNFINPFIIGGFFDPNFQITISSFPGLIKEVRWWSAARTQQQIISNRNIVLNSGLNPDLYGYWRCSEGNGTTVNDFSLHGLIGVFGDNSNTSLEPTWGSGCTGCTSPSAIITANGPTSFCPGSQVTLKTPTGNGKIYQWKNNGTSIPGATTASYSATASGTYKVNVANTNTGCSKTTGTGTLVTVFANPSPTITPQGPTTFCGGDSVQLKANFNSSYSYVWKKNNVTISNATSNKYEAKTAGNYKVKETNANGCTALSSNVTVSVPCRNEVLSSEIENYFDVHVYPNPSTGNFNCYLYSENNLNTKMQIYNVLGLLVFEASFGNGQHAISNTTLASGIYKAMFYNENYSKQITIIKSPE